MRTRGTLGVGYVTLAKQLESYCTIGDSKCSDQTSHVCRPNDVECRGFAMGCRGSGRVFAGEQCLR